MKIYTTNSKFKNIEWATDWARGIDWSSVPIKETDLPPNSDFIHNIIIETEPEIEMYYNLGTDSYLFAKIEKEYINGDLEFLSSQDSSGDFIGRFLKNDNSIVKIYSDRFYISDPSYSITKNLLNEIQKIQLRYGK